MTVDLTKDQYNTVSRLQNICADILDQITSAKQLVTEATDKGYGSGGANAITDSVLQSPVSGGSAPFPQLAAADLFAAITALTSLDTTLAATTRTGYKALEKLRP